MKSLIVCLCLQLARGVIVIENVDIKYNPKINRMIFTVERNAVDDLVVNMEHQFLVNYTKIFHTYSLNHPISDRDSNYQLQILKSKIDICKLQKGILGNFFIKIIMDGIAKANHDQPLMIMCPFLVGSFKIQNLVINENVFPSYLLKNTTFLFGFDGQGKISGAKSMSPLFSVKIFGRYFKRS